MKDKSTVIDKLDALLDFLAKSNNSSYPFDTILSKLEKDGYSFSPHELDRCLFKLVKDGNLISDERTVDFSSSGQPKRIQKTFYSISHDGELLHLSGGYSSKQSEQDQLNEIKRKQFAIEKRMVRLTFWIAAGTIIAAIYYLLSIATMLKIGNKVLH